MCALVPLGAAMPVSGADYARITPVSVDAQARHRVNMNATPEVIAESIAQLQQARADGLPRAAVDLGSLLLDYFPNDPAKKAEAIGYLEEGAAQGQGEAILRLLPLEEEAGTANAADLLARYQQAIEERGDADALIFAASTDRDPAKKHDYLYRAASVVDCTFENTIKLAGAFVDTADVAETEHWLRVSERLAGDDGWRHVAVGHRYMAMGGPERARTAIIEAINGKKQTFQTGKQRIEPFMLAWVEPLLRYHPDAATSAHVDHLRPLGHAKLGGNLTRIGDWVARLPAPGPAVRR